MLSCAPYGLFTFGLGLLVGLAVRRGARLAVLLAVVFVFFGQCAPRPALAAEPPLAHLDRILELRPPPDGGGPSCHGTPVGIVQILSAAHCVGSGVVRFTGQRRRDALGPIEGTAQLMWRDDTNDVAMFAAITPPGWEPVPIGKDPPAVTADVYWRFYLVRAVSSSARGQYHGLDSEGDMALSGPVTAGSSGSGVLNEQGELVGVLKFVYHPTVVSARSPLMSLIEAVELLFQSARMQPMAAATPVNKWPKP